MTSFKEYMAGATLAFVIATVFWAFQRELPRRVKADQRARCVLDQRAEGMR